MILQFRRIGFLSEHLPQENPLKDLPPPGTVRWVSSRKASVVNAVSAGLLTLEEACSRYNLSEDEFHSWEQMVHRHGVRGLRVTRLQQYRSGDSKHSA